MTRERVVVDTNVFVSGLLSATSGPARVVERAVQNGQLLASTDTLRELIETLLSAKFDRYVPRARREALLDRLAPNVEIVEIVQQVRACRDSKDDKFLELAVNGEADVIVSGDHDLLTLHPFRGDQHPETGNLPAPGTAARHEIAPRRSAAETGHDLGGAPACHAALEGRPGHRGRRTARRRAPKHSAGC